MLRNKIRKLILLSLMNAVAHADFGATVMVSNGDSDFTGTFITPQVLVTVAHGLNDLKTGGLKLSDGTKSTAVFIHSDLEKTGWKPGVKCPQTYDVAYVVFPAAKAREIAPLSDAEETLNPKDTATAVSMRNDVQKKNEETIVRGMLNDRKENAFLLLTNAGKFKVGDSGAAAYSDAGNFIGTMRGCAKAAGDKDESCGYLLVTSKLSLEVMKRGQTALPREFAGWKKSQKKK